MSQIDDFFRSRLDQMIDLRHPPAVLGLLLSVTINRNPWSRCRNHRSRWPLIRNCL